MTEKREMVKLLDERTIQVSLPTRIGYERIAMECSASFAGNGVHEIPEDTVVQEKLEKLEIERGLGIWLIKRLVDQVDFNDRTEEGHVVKMVLKSPKN